MNIFNNFIITKNVLLIIIIFLMIYIYLKKDTIDKCKYTTIDDIKKDLKDNIKKDPENPLPTPLCDTSKVKDMSDMFHNATNFNQDISSWNTNDVTDMNYMFYFATNFNQDISSWNTNEVKDMSGMFASATDFNQNISSWNLSSVEDMESMFTDSGVSGGNKQTIIKSFYDKINSKKLKYFDLQKYDYIKKQYLNIGDFATYIGF
jgi:surface protein